MRFLLKVTIPVEAGNAHAKDGFAALAQIVGELQPEAAYFVAQDGHRTALLFIHMDEPSQLPAVAEPFFLAFNAEVECTPAMIAEDLMKAGPAVAQAVEKYG